MYNPAPFPEHRREVLDAFLREHPLAVLISHGADGLQATHVPMALDAGAEERGVLRCHLARANPQWRTLAASPSVLVIFSGPEHYVSPSWYPSKREHGKVVPTWNYAAVHVRGRAHLVEEYELLLAHLESLTEQNEAAAGEHWAVEDAPEDYVRGLTKAIVGVAISIDSIEGKWKMSQNRPAADRDSVIEGLERIGSRRSVETAAEMKKRR